MSVGITEIDCTKIATRKIVKQFIKKKCAYFSGEIADSDRLRPDRLIVHLLDYRRRADKYNVCINVIESKVQDRYFKIKGNAYLEGVEQARNYYGNYCWLAVSGHMKLLDEEHEKLKADCIRSGVGLILCLKTRTEILIRPKFDDRIYLEKYPKYVTII